MVFITDYLDKQQELDLPSLRVDDSETARASSASRKAKDTAKDGVGSATSSASPASSTTANVSTPKAGGPSSSSGHVGRVMSHISGVKRPLSHSNSVTAEKVPKYGVETPNEHELGKVRARFRVASRVILMEHLVALDCALFNKHAEPLSTLINASFPQRL